MLSAPRYSSFFPNPLSNQLGIVHRQGQNRAWIFLSIFTLFCISNFLIVARRIALSLPFFTFSAFVLAGFVLYLFITFVIRRWFYDLIIKYQGILHPKLLVTIGMLVFLLLINSNPFFQLILFVTGILVGVDVFIQNQLHDIVSTIGPNSWVVNCLFPIFQIPFENDIKFELGDRNQYFLAVKYSKPFFSKSENEPDMSILLPNNIIKPDKLDRYLSSSANSSLKGALSLILVSPIEKRNTTRSIEIYKTQKPVELKELLAEIQNLVEYDLVEA